MTAPGLIRLACALLLAAMLAPDGLGAQGAGTLGGTVRSERGDPLHGIEVHFDPGGLRTETGRDGAFRLTIPAGTAGTLRFRGVGFVPAERSVAGVVAGGVASVAVTLQAIVALDALTVVARRARPLLNTDDAATGGAIERDEIEALPTDARNPLTLAFNIPGVAQSTGYFGDAPPLTIHGANALYTPYLVDGLDNTEGFLGGPRVEIPLSAISRLAVRTSGYGAAVGRSSNGVVEIETIAGSNRPRGDLFGYWRPGRPLDARTKLPDGADPAVVERQQGGFRRFQVGGALAGALARDRTFVAVAAEYGNETEDRVASTALTAFTGSELRETLKLFGRLDHGWSPNQTTTLRFAMSHVNRAGEGSGIVVPEADITTQRIGTITALTHRSALPDGRSSNIVSLQFGTFRWNFPPTRSDLSRPQVTIIAPDGTPLGVVGSSNFVFDETERQLQFRNVFATRLGTRHTLSAGVDVLRGSFRLAGASTNPNGAYTVYDDGNISQAGEFLSIADLPADVRVRDYTIDANPQQVDLTQTRYGAFIENRWRATDNLVVLAGLRWDYDDLTSRGASRADLDNVQPRLSFNWLASPTTVIRGSAGVHVGTLPYAVYSDAVQFGPEGNAPVTFAAGTDFPPPAFGSGPRAEDLATLQGRLPPREVRAPFALGLRQPVGYQATLGWQRTLGTSWSVAIDFVLHETRNLPRSWDLNPITRPLTAADTVDRSTMFGDPFRPVAPVPGGFRRLTTTESGGRSRHLGMSAAVRRAFAPGWSVDANWVWSGTRTDTEDINFNATHGNDFGAEWAWATNDRRHKVTVRSLHEVATGVRAAVIGDWQSGQPINRVAFFRDLDGSGPIFGNGFVGNHDRFPGVRRNAERLPAFFELAGSLSYALRFGGRTLELRADAFNLLNGTHWGNFANGIPGGGSRTQVGRPGDPVVLKNPGRPRQLQLSGRHAF